MLFTADIGALTITLGVFDGETLRFRASLSASRERTADEYAVLLAQLFRMRGVEPKMEGAVLSSVSKPLNAVMAGAVERICGVRPVFLGPGVRTGLDIRADIPSQLGGDIAACCIGALHLQKPPLAVLGFGAATTLAYLDEKGQLCGVMICPGVQPGLDALSALAGELPTIALEPPRSLLGRNTVDAMNSGGVFGAAAMADGLLARVREAYGKEELPVIAAGDMAPLILPHCESEIRHEPDLVLKGLHLVWERNRRPRK